MSALPARRPEEEPSQLDETLALLAQERPRPGLERRMLAQLAYARMERPSWLRRATAPQHMKPVLCLAAVALFSIAGLEYYGAHQRPEFRPAHAPIQTMSQGVAAAGRVAVAQKPIHPSLRLRGRRPRAGRGQHGRVLLAPGATAATHRNLRLVPAR